MQKGGRLLLCLSSGKRNERFIKYWLILCCMTSDYAEKASGGLPIVAGTIVKYASLLAGIYSVCKDEQDFPMAVGMGMAYLLGESLQRAGESRTAQERFSQLEEILKKE